MNKGKSWLYISILTFLLVAIWAGVSAVAKMRESTISPQIESLMTPLDPKLDKSFFIKLQERGQ